MSNSQKNRPSPAGTMRAYGYIRVSTEEQAVQGLSLEAQRRKIEAYAVVQDLDLIEVVADEGYSGKDLDRPGFQRLLEIIRNDQAEALIVWKLDRLTRNTRDLLWLIEDVFRGGNTRFFSLSEHIDTDTAMGKFFLTLMGALAQMERELISERTRAALEVKKSLGEHLGTTPLGFELGEDGKLQENPKELEIVAMIKKLRKRGTKFRKIARILNERGIPTKRGGKWHDSTVRYILKNKRYKGTKSPDQDRQK